MFEPGLPDLFKAVAVISAAAHSIKVLRNNGMIDVRQRKPVQRLVAVVARGGSNSQPDEASITPILRHFRQVTNDHIRSSRQRGCFWARSASQRWHSERLDFAVDDCTNLDRL